MNPNVFSILNVIDKFSLSDAEMRELFIALNKKVNTDPVQLKQANVVIATKRETQEQVNERMLQLFKNRNKKSFG